MRLSEFWDLMEQEFGQGYAAVVARTQVLGPLGQTADEALEAGVPARRVWEAVVTAMDVPPEHQWLPEPRPGRQDRGTGGQSAS